MIIDPATPENHRGMSPRAIAARCNAGQFGTMAAPRRSPPMTRLTLLPILVLLLHPAAGNASEDPLTMSSGAELFTRLCASCHGAQATGNGPLAASLRHPPSDLTAIAERNGGTFPAERVREMIDGRAAPTAHGTREMPVWGYELEARAPAGRAAAQAMTDRLVDYLASLQK